MSKRLFVFAVGGTGSRVLKSLVMLLAAGVKPSGEPFEIVPIIIDPHEANEDLKRTVALMEDYQNIVDKIGTETGFFSTSLKTLAKIDPTGNTLQDSYAFNMKNVAGQKFKDYIGYEQMDDENAALVDILFSGRSIDAHGRAVSVKDVNMDIGFVGNPNIGSVVLNDVRNSPEYKAFANNFGEQDRIFIISSIFGGTGAAGFPALLKNIRQADGSTAGYLRESAVGALTIMPYFNIENDDKSPINRGDWFQKTRSALEYYRQNVTPNVLYYLGDNGSASVYKNDPGTGGQKNDAHVIELIGALAIIDFLEMDDRELKSPGGRPSKPKYKEFGIEGNDDIMNLMSWNKDTREKLNLKTAAFYLFSRYFNHYLPDNLGKDTWMNDAPVIHQSFKATNFYKDMEKFLLAYNQWLGELSTNRRGYSPFNLSIKEMEKMYAGIEPRKTGIFGSSRLQFSHLDEYLNPKTDSNKYTEQAEKLMRKLHEATKRVLSKRFDHFHHLPETAETK